jgi:hypothetical protein
LRILRIGIHMPRDAPNKSTVAVRLEAAGFVVVRLAISS